MKVSLFSSMMERHLPVAGSIPMTRMTWWPRRGTTEWVEYEFPEPRTISRSSVYWFDDTGRGACRVPKSWRLLQHDGTTWQPVELQPGVTYHTARDRWNQVEFSPAVHQRELHAFGTAEGIATVGYERCASFTTRISLHQPTPTHRYSHYGMCWMALHEAEASGVTYGVTDLTQHAEVAAVAAEAGCTAAQALLRWSLQHGVVCIPKTAREGRLQEALGALHVELSGAQMGRLDTLSAIGRGLRGTEASIRNHLTLLETKLDPQFVRTSIDVR